MNAILADRLKQVHKGVSLGKKKRIDSQVLLIRDNALWGRTPSCVSKACRVSFAFACQNRSAAACIPRIRNAAQRSVCVAFALEGFFGAMYPNHQVVRPRNAAGCRIAATSACVSCMLGFDGGQYVGGRLRGALTWKSTRPGHYLGFRGAPNLGILLSWHTREL